MYITKAPFFLFLIMITVSIETMAQNVIINHYDVIEQTAITNSDSTSIAFKSSVTYKEKSSGDYIQILPLYSHSSFNTEYAYGFNDGYFWQGNGFNQNFSIGVQGRYGNFEYTLAPQLVMAQNTDFDLRSDYGTRPPYQDRFVGGIDYVKRYGEDTLLDFYLGQSELAYSYKNVRLSINTQNTIWGPGVFNQAMMSNNANGFPNLRVGSDQPWNTRIGNLEMQWMFGLTEESDYFNTDKSDDTQIFNGFVLGYEPTFFPGFSISMHRMMRILEKDKENSLDYFKLATDFFRTSQKDDQGIINERADQMFSIGMDWRSKSDDFRIYLEWIRGDFWSHLNDLVTQIEHNVGYTWGFIKKFELQNDRYLRLIFENSNLATWETARLRSSGSLYTHTRVRQGYTNNGQVMGAYIGPGSSNHSLNLSYHNNDMAIIFEYYRTRFNDDAFYLRLYQEVGNYQDISHHFALNFRNTAGSLEYLAGIDFSYRDNYLFVPDDYRFNLHPHLILRYKFNQN